MLLMVLKCIDGITHPDTAALTLLQNLQSGTGSSVLHTDQRIKKLNNTVSAIPDIQEDISGSLFLFLEKKFRLTVYQEKLMLLIKWHYKH